MDTVRQRPRRLVALGLGLATIAGVAVAGTALAGSPAAEQARAQPLVPGTPCSITAKACVDLDSQRSWLIQDGKVIRGPIGISSGGNGQETPVGHSLRVYRKDATHKSEESRLPNGDPNRSSAGCIHVPPDEAKAYFDYLQIGDQVQVVKASEETAARNGK
ncbi:L,D-transpeptidase [Pseudonocardia sp. ICBG1034]|uniref:L,D-transpeptidase n=1 Tax=Pseudonocardia sp. ICBG1034 TaxID=2844381 RepID=UPI001CCD6B75|nr:L,D-transpeptidase [Pseudonocardia sp. ICBG1034]